MAKPKQQAYEQTKYQGFKTFEETKKVMDDYCGHCAYANASCKTLFGMQTSEEFERNFWSSDLVRRILKSNKKAEEEVVCVRFKMKDD